MKFEAIRKPLLLACLSASIVLHGSLFYFFYEYPSLHKIVQNSVRLKPNPSPEILSGDREELLVSKIEQALEDSLSQIITAIPKETDLAKEDIKWPEEEILDAYAVSETQPFTSLSLQSENHQLPPLFDPEASLSLAPFAFEDPEETNDDLFPYQIQEYTSIDLSESILKIYPNFQVIKGEEEISESSFHPTPDGSHLKLDSLCLFAIRNVLDLLPVEEIENAAQDKDFTINQPIETALRHLIMPNAVDYLREEWVNRQLTEAELPSLDYYGMDKIAADVDWKEDADVEVSYITEGDKNRYVFSLTIHPDLSLEAAPIPQHFYFILDHSQSLEKGKFERYKRALQRSLSALNEGDTFNILFFEKGVTRLSDESLPVNPKTIQLAQEFLETQNHKNKFVTKDPYTSLDSLIPAALTPNDMHSVILISDGNSLMNQVKQREALAKWLKKNQGLINFYTATCGKDNNLVLLDLLSHTSGGKFLYSDTNAAFPRKLVKLVKDLHAPLAKNLSLDFLPKDPNANIQMTQGNAPMAPLFYKQPYIIVGSINEFCDFTFILQGQNGDRFFSIKKTISLKDANKGGRTVAKLWANAQAQACYERFLSSGKSTHLRQAKEIVAPFEGVIALDN